MQSWGGTRAANRPRMCASGLAPDHCLMNPGVHFAAHVRGFWIKQKVFRLFLALRLDVCAIRPTAAYQSLWWRGNEKTPMSSIFSVVRADDDCSPTINRCVCQIGHTARVDVGGHEFAVTVLTSAHVRGLDRTERRALASAIEVGPYWVAIRPAAELTRNCGSCQNRRQECAIGE